MPARERITRDPAQQRLDPQRLPECIDACLACAQACTSCADACLTEDSVAELIDCIRADLDCADMCEATGRLLSQYAAQPTNLVKAFLDTCAAACRTCAEECEKHASMHEHCASCARACRRCERACRNLAATLS
jgi:hypothetical protein